MKSAPLCCASSASARDGVLRRDVVAGFFRLLRLGLRVGRCADDILRPLQVPRCLNRDGCFFKLYAIGVDGESDVHPIIDKKSRVILPANLARSLSENEQVLTAEIFLS